MKKGYIYALALSLGVFMFGAGFSIAAFMDKGEILGSTFSVGSADIKLLQDLTLGAVDTNLADTLTGPSFTNISPNWVEDYPVKIYNNATTEVTLSSNSNYETINDPEDLRQIVFVEPFDWNDVNSDGVVNEGELGASYGRKTVIKWKTEGYDLGTLSTGEIKSLVLRFSTDAVSETKQGATALFDFLFNSAGL